MWKTAFLTVGIAAASAVVAISSWVAYMAVAIPPRVAIPLARIEAQELYEPDPRTGFRPRARARMSDTAGSRTFTVATDEIGARAGPAATPDPGRALITIGCSQAWGHGVDERDTFSALAAGALKLRSVNLSVQGFGGIGSLLRLRDNAELRPAYVVYGFWEDHLNRNVRPCVENGSPVCLERPHFSFSREGDPVLRLPTDAAGRFARTREWYLETTSATDRHRTFGSDMKWTALAAWRKFMDVLSPEPAWPLKMRAADVVLTQMSALSKEIGADLIVVYIPLYFSDTIADAPAEIAGASRRQGFPLVSMGARFRALRERGIDIGIPGDNHLTPAAHAAIAEEVLAAIALMPRR